jgi:hypothetical protein
MTLPFQFDVGQDATLTAGAAVVNLAKSITQADARVSKDEASLLFFSVDDRELINSGLPYGALQFKQIRASERANGS